MKHIARYGRITTAAELMREDWKRIQQRMADDALVDEIQANEAAWRRQQAQAAASPIYHAPAREQEDPELGLGPYAPQ